MAYDWFKGVVVPLVTPLTERETLDTAAMTRLVQRQVEAGVDALFVLGSAGEGPMLSTAMQRDVVRLACEVASGRVPVLAGASDNSLALVLERLEDLATLGIRAGVCTLPYYGWYDNPAGEIAFFGGLADRSPVPVIPYNLPRVVGVSLKAETVRALYGHPNIAGLKDTNTDVAAMEAIARDPARPPEFKYLPGNSALASRLLAAGANGFVPAPANIKPEPAVALYSAHCRGDEMLAQEMGRCLGKLNEILSHPTTPGGIKMALEVLGVCSRRTFRPWPQADAEDERIVRGVLEVVDAMYQRALAQSSGEHTKE